MLAIYDSAANQLAGSQGFDQTTLYHELLTRFTRRELDKDVHSFRQLPVAEQREQPTRELERLGVAAIGMFNRQSLAIRGDQFNANLRYFGLKQNRPAATHRPLTQADLLLGSFFLSTNPGPACPRRSLLTRRTPRPPSSSCTRPSVSSSPPTSS